MACRRSSRRKGAIVSILQRGRQWNTLLAVAAVSTIAFTGTPSVSQTPAPTQQGQVTEQWASYLVFIDQSGYVQAVQSLQNWTASVSPTQCHADALANGAPPPTVGATVSVSGALNGASNSYTQTVNQMTTNC